MVQALRAADAPAKPDSGVVWTTGLESATTTRTPPPRSWLDAFIGVWLCVKTVALVLASLYGICLLLSALRQVHAEEGRWCMIGFVVGGDAAVPTARTPTECHDAIPSVVAHRRWQRAKRQADWTRDYDYYGTLERTTEQWLPTTTTRPPPTSNPWMTTAPMLSQWMPSTAMPTTSTYYENYADLVADAYAQAYVKQAPLTAGQSAARQCRIFAYAACAAVCVCVSALYTGAAVVGVVGRQWRRVRAAGIVQAVETANLLVALVVCLFTPTVVGRDVGSTVAAGVASVAGVFAVTTKAMFVHARRLQENA